MMGSRGIIGEKGSKVRKEDSALLSPLPEVRCEQTLASEVYVSEHAQIWEEAVTRVDEIPSSTTQNYELCGISLYSLLFWQQLRSALVECPFVCSLSKCGHLLGGEYSKMSFATTGETLIFIYRKSANDLALYSTQGYMGAPGVSGKDGETGKEVCMDF